MKKTYLFFVFILLCQELFTQNISWARNLGGGAAGATGFAIAADSLGNVYTTGEFEGTVDFDPGPGVYNLTSNGGFDVFISMVDVQGNFVWAGNIGGPSGDDGVGIAVNANGEIFVSGTFAGTADFDPGNGVFNLTANGPTDIFILKVDATGNMLWAEHMGGGGTVQGTGLALDSLGDVYTTGYFISTVDFDPGPGVYNLQPQAVDVFISKLDGNGQFVWARRMGGNATDYPLSIATDPFGNVYTVGYFSSSNADFDPGFGVFTLSPGGFLNNNGFISKLDASGNFLWAKGLLGSGTCQTSGVAFDKSGNPVLTGSYIGQIDFDPGPGNTSSSSMGNTPDIFISKLDTLGNLMWTSLVAGTGTDIASHPVVDPSGNIFTTGNYNGTADFDPGGGVFNLSPVGGYDMFISELDSLGNFVWAGSAGDVGDDSGNGIAGDASGNFYITGVFLGTVYFDFLNQLSAAGQFDAMVLKYQNCSSLLNGQPASQVVPSAGIAQFVVSAPGSSGTYQWQEDVGSGFVSLQDGGSYSGVTTATLIINQVTLQQNDRAYRCIVSQGNCTVMSQSGLLSVYDNTGLSKMSANQSFLMYPNPASELVQIQRGAGLSASPYSICDQTGRLMQEGQLSGNLSSVNIQNLPKGLYFLRVGDLSQKPVKLIKE